MYYEDIIGKLNGNTNIPWNCGYNGCGKRVYSYDDGRTHDLRFICEDGHISQWKAGRNGPHCWKSDDERHVVLFNDDRKKFVCHNCGTPFENDEIFEYSRIRIIPFTKDYEIKNDNDFKQYILQTCKKDRHGALHRKSIAGIGKGNTPRGSILIFQREGILKGEGYVYTDIQEETDLSYTKKGDNYSFILYPQTIRLFSTGIRKSDFEKEIGRQIGDQTALLVPSEYKTLIESVKKKGFEY